MKLLKTSKILLVFALIFSLLLGVFYVYFVGGYKKHYKLVKSVCNTYNVEFTLALAVMKTESNFKSDAVSSKGAIGLMQVTQKTAEYVANLYDIKGEIDLKNQATNTLIGVCYLDYLSSKFTDKNAVICAYNAGETRVKGWLDFNGNLNPKTIPYKETKNYLKLVNFRKKLYTLLLN